MLDPVTLRIRALSNSIDHGVLRTLGPAGPGVLSVLDGGQDVLYLMDLKTNAFLGRHELRIECTNGSGVVPTDLEFPAGGPLFLTSVDSNAPVIYALPWPALFPCPQATFFEWPAIPYAIHTSWDPTLLIAAVSRESPDRQTSLAMFDPAAVAYVPGAVTVGQGATSHLVQDSKGRIFGALLWTGTVFRAEAAP
jgi:hypothetical protein